MTDIPISNNTIGATIMPVICNIFFLSFFLVSKHTQAPQSRSHRLCNILLYGLVGVWGWFIKWHDGCDKWIIRLYCTTQFRVWGTLNIGL